MERRLLHWLKCLFSSSSFRMFLIGIFFLKASTIGLFIISINRWCRRWFFLFGCHVSIARWRTRSSSCSTWSRWCSWTTFPWWWCWWKSSFCPLFSTSSASMHCCHWWCCCCCPASTSTSTSSTMMINTRWSIEISIGTRWWWWWHHGRKKWRKTRWTIWIIVRTVISRWVHIKMRWIRRIKIIWSKMMHRWW